MSVDSPTENARIHAIVSGLVQGVSFRYYTQEQAAKTGVVGWVRNQRDGSVEVMAEGAQPALESLVTFLRSGPPSAKVSNLEVSWQEPTGEFHGFDVRY